jgi:aminodeoxyfutalosine synthase
MRDKYCPEKISPDKYLGIHGQAHQLGLVTNCSMLFGMDETPQERVDHLLALRDAQDKTGGFSAFIPLAYQGGNDEAYGQRPSPLLSLSVIAVSRLILDNFPHIKAYWPMIGIETAAAAFSWGADDLDGTLGEEQIAHASGAQTPKALSVHQMEETIRLGGFVPFERSGAFNFQDARDR